jgi:hypothetical protein
MLAKFAAMVEDVWHELAGEGFEAQPTRTRLAQQIFALARHRWTEIQMRELLLRGFRNEAARMRREASAP